LLLSLYHVRLLYEILLEIRSVERGICPIAVLYFAVKRSFLDI